MKAIYLVIIFIFLNACSGVLLKPDMSRVADKSKAYRAGYKEGCNSGFVAGGYNLGMFSRDSERSRNDQEYNTGWKRGYKECKEDFRKMCREGGLLSEASLHCTDVRQQGLDKIEE